MKKCLLTGLVVMAVLVSVAAASDVTQLSHWEESPDIDISDIPVYAPGEYDLGNGVMLTVEHIPGMEAVGVADYRIFCRVECLCSRGIL